MALMMKMAQWGAWRIGALQACCCMDSQWCEVPLLSGSEVYPTLPAVSSLCSTSSTVIASSSTFVMPLRTGATPLLKAAILLARLLLCRGIGGRPASLAAADNFPLLLDACLDPSDRASEKLALLHAVVVVLWALSTGSSGNNASCWCCSLLAPASATWMKHSTLQINPDADGQIRLRDRPIASPLPPLLLKSAARKSTRVFAVPLQLKSKQQRGHSCKCAGGSQSVLRMYSLKAYLYITSRLHADE